MGRRSSGRSRAGRCALRTGAALVAAVSIASAVALAPDAGASTRRGTPSAVVAGLSLHSIACVSAGVCLGVGSNSKDDGQAAVIAAASATGKLGHNDLSGTTLAQVACPTASKCLATTDSGTVVSISTSDADLTKTATVPAPKGWTIWLTHIACASSTSCYAVGYEYRSSPRSEQGVVVHLSGKGDLLGTVAEKSVNELSAIACPTTTRCIVVADRATGADELQLVNKGVPGSEHAFPAGFGVAALTCYGDTACFALASKSLGPGGYIPPSPWLADVDPSTGAPGKKITIAGKFYGTDLACASASVCVATGTAKAGSSYEVAAVIYKKGKISGTDKLAGNSDGATEVACATSSVCIAVNAYGPPTSIDRISV